MKTLVLERLSWAPCSHRVLMREQESQTRRDECSKGGVTALGTLKVEAGATSQGAAGKAGNRGSPRSPRSAALLMLGFSLCGCD